MTDLAVRGLRPRAEALRALARRAARPTRDALVIVGVARALWYFFVQGIQPWTFLGVDTRAYWQVDLAHPYAHAQLGEVSSYLYSPAFAQAVSPLGLLPFELVYVLWTSASLVILAWLIRPWPWAGAILCLPIIYELCVGNIHFFLAAMTVLAFRAPWMWALPLLTKITPGIGVVWFALRLDWRGFAVAVGATGAIAGASFLLAPNAWFEWVAYLTSSPAQAELLPLRLAAAVAILAVGARARARWVVPIAVWLTLPAVYVSSWVILLAIIRLARPDTNPRPLDSPR